jgi:N-acetyl-gamma-glutamyl-phosphate reductase
VIDLELSPVARRIVEELAEVTADEEVLVVSDPEKVSVGRAITTAARGSGATATLSVMPRLDAHGNEPPAAVASSMEAVDVAFTATTHAITHTQARLAASDAGTRVVDLSSDFRLKSVGHYGGWYNVDHPAPHLLEEAVYGLTEVFRADLPQARLVANPGCYPTGVLLALRPLLEADAARGTLVVDSKSGVSGAGRTPKQTTHFVEVADNFSPYNIGRTHRHVPEIEQNMRLWNGNPPGLVFSPHLLPVPRGILSTIYVSLPGGWTEKKVRELYAACYDGEPFIRVLGKGQLATLAHVNYTNRCALGLTLTKDTLIITAAIDNLVKGAAGQAVQNANAMFGLDEMVGLE